MKKKIIKDKFYSEELNKKLEECCDGSSGPLIHEKFVAFLLDINTWAKNQGYFNIKYKIYGFNCYDNWEPDIEISFERYETDKEFSERRERKRKLYEALKKDFEDEAD